MFPEKLKQARKNANLSQKELASKLNITQQSLANWESGKTTPRQKRLEEISQILKIPISDLLASTSNIDLYNQLQNASKFKEYNLSISNKKDIEKLIEAYLKGID